MAVEKSPKRRIKPISREEILAGLKETLAQNQSVKFAYLFGSRARGAGGRLSDIDIAVYLDRRISPFAFRLRLAETLARELGTDRLDLITLNDAPLLLRYEVVRGGLVIKEDKQRRVNFEQQVLREYLDTAILRRTQRAYLKKSLVGEGGFGQ